MRASKTKPDLSRAFGVLACDDMAAMFVERIMLRLGGEEIYIPRKKLKDRHRIIRDIRARYNGQNAATLARKHGVSQGNRAMFPWKPQR